MLRVHSTRLFPKQSGADKYVATGIAARCDWVLYSDQKAPEIQLRGVESTRHPRHIYLSLRAPVAALTHFASEILPKLTTPFILVSGSEDCTFPVQTDARWRPFDAPTRAAIDAILASPLLKHWAAENLDLALHPKLRPLPAGMVFSDAPKIRDMIEVPDVPALAHRPLTVLCAHRVREGAQWQLRKQVTACAKTHWGPFCHLVEHELPEAAFLELCTRHAFVLCAEGGGLDPSPKAWQAILHGAIPIIRRTPVTPAYAHLPVAVVEDWAPAALTPARLAEWRADLAPWQDTEAGRGETLHRLGADYWWNYACADRDAPPAEAEAV